MSESPWCNYAAVKALPQADVLSVFTCLILLLPALFFVCILTRCCSDIVQVPASGDDTWSSSSSSNALPVVAWGVTAVLPTDAFTAASAVVAARQKAAAKAGAAASAASSSAADAPPKENGGSTDAPAVSPEDDATATADVPTALAPPSDQLPEVAGGDPCWCLGQAVSLLWEGLSSEGDGAPVSVTIDDFSEADNAYTVQPLDGSGEQTQVPASVVWAAIAGTLTSSSTSAASAGADTGGATSASATEQAATKAGRKGRASMSSAAAASAPSSSTAADAVTLRFLKPLLPQRITASSAIGRIFGPVLDGYVLLKVLRGNDNSDSGAAASSSAKAAADFSGAVRYAPVPSTLQPGAFRLVNGLTSRSSPNGGVEVDVPLSELTSGGEYTLGCRVYVNETSCPQCFGCKVASCTACGCAVCGGTEHSTAAASNTSSSSSPSSSAAAAAAAGGGEESAGGEHLLAHLLCEGYSGEVCTRMVHRSCTHRVPWQLVRTKAGGTDVSELVAKYDDRAPNAADAVTPYVRSGDAAQEKREAQTAKQQQQKQQEADRQLETSAAAASGSNSSKKPAKKKACKAPADDGDGEGASSSSSSAAAAASGSSSSSSTGGRGTLKRKAATAAAAKSAQGSYAAALGFVDSEDEDEDGDDDKDDDGDDAADEEDTDSEDEEEEEEAEAEEAGDDSDSSSEGGGGGRIKGAGARLAGSKRQRRPSAAPSSSSAPIGRHMALAEYRYASAMDGEGGRDCVVFICGLCEGARVAAEAARRAAEEKKKQSKIANAEGKKGGGASNQGVSSARHAVEHSYNNIEAMLTFSACSYQFTLTIPRDLYPRVYFCRCTTATRRIPCTWASCLLCRGV